MNDTVLIDRLGVVLEDLLAEVRHLRADLRERTAGAASSVQLEQGAKEIRLTVKVYQDSPVGEIGDEAIDEFGRLFREIERQQMNGWTAPVDALNGGRTG